MPRFHLRLLHTVSIALATFALFRDPALSEPVSKWQLRDAGTTRSLTAVTANSLNQVVIAVGEQGTIIRSSDDGQTWTSCASGTSETLTSIAPIIDGYIAVGTRGTILFSSDGITWSPEASPTRLRLNHVSDTHAVGEVGVGLLTRQPNGQWIQEDPGFADTTMYYVSSSTALGANGTVYKLAISTQQPTWVKQPPVTSAALYTATGFNDDMFGADGYGVPITTETLRDSAVLIGGYFRMVTLGYHPEVGETFVVGTNGSVFRKALIPPQWGGPCKGWMADPAPTRENLNGITKVRSGVLVVGDGGTVLFHPNMPPVITREAHATYDAQGNPFIEAEVHADGAWSECWLESTYRYPLGTDYPTQSLTRTRFPLPGPGFQFAAANGFGVALSYGAANQPADFSARANVGTDENALIIGFSVPNGQKHLLLRVVGAGLAQFGVKNPLKHPRLRLFTASSVPYPLPAATADTGGVGAFPIDLSSGDLGYIVTLGGSTPSNYTVVVDATDGSPGVGLVELYDLDPPTSPMLMNISARAAIGSGENLLVGGLVVQGGLRRQYLLRGAGPALRALGVQSPLARPRLTLFQGTSPLRTNAGWSTEPNAEAIRSASNVVGAFAFEDGSADCALLTDLVEGSYTLQISGENDSTGIAVFEAYLAQ